MAGANMQSGIAGPKRFRTTRGKRRLSYEEAYARRTTDSSRARVMALYGKLEPPKGQKAPSPPRVVPGNVTNTAPRAGSVGSLQSKGAAPKRRRRRKPSTGGALAPRY